MELTGIYTPQGLSLLAKILAGETLAVTRAQAGAGETPEDAQALDQPRQALTLLSPTRKEDTCTLPVTLAAYQAEAAYALTEIGLYAQDSEAGEILFKIYRLDAPVNIVPASRTVLRFYLSETVSGASPVTAQVSPAGVLLASDFETVRQVVEYAAPGLPTREVTVAAPELRAYINALPRLLMEDLRITVTGTTADTILLQGFYGPGAFRIVGAEGCVVGNISISTCCIPVQVWDVDVQPPAGATSPCVTGAGIQYARFSSCRLIGNGLGRGVGCGDGTRLILENCQISNCTTAVFAGRNTTISVVNDFATAAGIHDNQTGCHVWYGGIILLCVSAPDLMGGTSNTKQGGIIAKANGTLL